MATYTGWHFLADPAKLAYDGGPVPPVGASVSIDGEPTLCKRGFHACKLALGALYYARGPWVERVRLEGVVVVDEDKAAGTRRVSLTAPVNVHTLLVSFAADEAERVLPIYEAEHPGDGRPRKAIEAARAWASCPCGEHRRAADAANADAANAANAAANAATYAAANARARQERTLARLLREAVK